MKAIIFSLLLFKMSLYVGREMRDCQWACQRLNEMICRAHTIRVQLNFGVKLKDFISVCPEEREEQFKKFDSLWIEFKYLQTTLRHNLNSEQKKQLAEFVVLMRSDKTRYAQERRNTGETLI